MKKCVILMVAMFLCSRTSFAQEIVTDFWHENGKYFNLHNIVETSNDCLIVECPMFEQAYGADLGNVFYKFSMKGEIIDTLFLPSSNVPLRTLFEPVPNNKGLLMYGRFEQELSDSTTYLKLTFIDDALQLVDNIDVEIADTLYDFMVSSSDLFIDPYGDLIVSYWCNQRFYMLRIGIDGTIKQRQRVDGIAPSLLIHERHTNVYSESPLLYYYIGSYYSSGVIECYIVDSVFQVVDEHQFGENGNSTFTGRFKEHIIPMDSETYLLSSRYKIGPNPPTNAEALAKCNKNHEVMTIRTFSEGISNPSPIWTIVMDDGTIYHSYMTDAGAPNRLVLVRLDADLNVLWARYFLEPDMFHWGTCMTVLSDGRIAVGSYRYSENPGSVSVVVVKDNYDNLEELNIHMRPYNFYPNPTKDVLQLRYSPDVTPKQIELYDLQGRLVRTQRNGLERLNMEGLTAGTYTLRVTMVGGQTFSNKVMKE